MEDEPQKTITLPIALINLVLQAAIAAGGGAAAYTLLPPRIDATDGHSLDSMESDIRENRRMANANASEVKVLAGNDQRCKERADTFDVRLMNLEAFVWQRKP